MQFVWQLEVTKIQYITHTHTHSLLLLGFSAANILIVLVWVLANLSLAGSIIVSGLYLW